MLEILAENSWLVFGLAATCVVAGASYFAWQRHQRGPTHPPFSERDVRFTERFVSGFSDKNFFTRLVGVHNALVVRVLEDALVIEPFAMFKWITPAGFNDLEHYVPRKDILSVTSTSILGRERFQIRFRAKDGQARTVELTLRKPEAFKAAMR